MDSVPWGHIVDTAMGAVRERQANPDGRFDASSHWFRALRQNPGRMGRHEIDSAAFNAVAAGSDTVSSGIQAFLYSMLRHPTAWQRARQEMVDAGLADRQGPISFAETQGLPFLQACCKEALRVFGPGASKSFPRRQTGLGVMKNGVLISRRQWAWPVERLRGASP